LYFENNLTSLINLLKCVQEFQTPHFVFSSSCSVYGNPDEIPVTEKTILKPAESPYGYTKQMGEQVVNEFAKSSGIHCILLRYFNPAGAHPSIHIGEMPIGSHQILFPQLPKQPSDGSQKCLCMEMIIPREMVPASGIMFMVCDLARAQYFVFELS
jgi:UDP-glucose 4-epimerase